LSSLWTSGDPSHGLPTDDGMLREVTEGRMDGMACAADWS
jgi:hypothetical protein